MRNVRNELLIRNIARKVKKLREEKKITQEVFYLDTGIHIGRLEAEKVNPSISTLKVVSDYFGLSLAEFFKGL